MRLVEIGEAINGVSTDLLATDRAVPWKEVVAMRHKLAHRYFDTVRGIVEGTVVEDLPELEAAVMRLLKQGS
jgi:uncharacterized protein with HEPN domain